jgi:hypothetical protein
MSYEEYMHYFMKIYPHKSEELMQAHYKKYTEISIATITTNYTKMLTKRRKTKIHQKNRLSYAFQYIEPKDPINNSNNSSPKFPIKTTKAVPKPKHQTSTPSSIFSFFVYSVL